MSATMDFSPLKMETPHSSPHRTPLKASPMCSPHGEDMDPPVYSNVGYSRSSSSFCGSGPRSQFSLPKDEFKGGHDSACLTRTLQSPAKTTGSRSRSSSPVLATFLKSDDSASGAAKFSGNISGLSSGLESLSSLELSKRYSEAVMAAASSSSDGGTSRDVFDKLSALARERGVLQCGARRPRSASDSVEMLDDADDSVVETKGDDDDDVSSSNNSDKEEEDEDQIECAECNRVFCNLQRYMDHTCCRSHANPNAICDKIEAQPSTSPNFIFNESCTSDAEIFKGRIVYTPNGSAYIIEGSGADSDLELRLSLQPDSIVVNDGQSVLSVDRSIPKIANALFFSKSNRSVEPSGKNARDNLRQENNLSPVIHRYNVYELRSSEIDDLLELFPPYPVGNSASKPILMCFICKLSFASPTSFLRHATLDHRMELNEGERTLLSRPSASALIQAFGMEKYPTVTVLQQVIDTDSPPLDRISPIHSRGRSREETYSNNFISSRAKSSSPEESGFSRSPFNLDARASRPRSPASEQQDELIASHRSSSSSAYSSSMKRESYLQSPLMSGADFLSGNHFLYTSQGDRSSPKRMRSPSSVMPSPQRASSPLTLSASESFYPLSSTSGLMLSSAGHQQHLGMPASSLQSMSLGLANFLGSCDEHPQGRAQGVECPKCDMVLGSSQSLGGHMTMTHSRNSCKTLKCPKCNWHYKYQETLEIHMKEKHPDSDAQCVYCLTNQSHPRLARGESYSCGYKPYRCDVCNYSTTTKGNLSIHMQSDKHINNMQDLANGSTEIKLQPPPQSPAAQSLPPSSSSTPAPPSHSAPSSYSQEDPQLKKLKQKQSFRCEVCSYETSVARNLRIHMTSEKHTHNMLVMTQSINHLHQDMTLHQISQMNQLLALNHQEQAARFAAISPHLNTGLFSYENMLMSAAAVPPPPPPPSQTSFEMPMNLTKENGLDDSLGPAPGKDASKLFHCCVCNSYGSDSLESVHNHIQYDRTKSGNSEAHVTFSNGAYHCNLCSYKTHLKANFQLHCKTDKHLQKLQLVNHVLEGGIENEWRLAVSGSPMQICCNACGFYANSTHKMQLHTSTLQHESCSQLFRHLQLLEHATFAAGGGSSSSSSKVRYYQCTLCSVNVRTKQRLILHSRTSRHVCKEQSLPQGHLSIFDVFLIKEFSDGLTVDFEDEAPEPRGTGFVQHMKIDDDTLHTPELTQEARDLSNYPKVTSVGGRVTIPPPAHFATTTAASGSLGTASATDYSAFRGGSCTTSRDKSGGDPEEDPLDISLSHSLTSRISSSSESNGVHHNPQSNHGPPPPPQQQQQQKKYGSSSPPTEPGAGARSEGEGAVTCILCPLCRHECSGTAPLEDHLIKKHNVAPEGIQRLMSMVELPISTGPAMATTDPQVSAAAAASSAPPPGDTSKSTSAPHSEADTLRDIRKGNGDLCGVKQEDKQRGGDAPEKVTPTPAVAPSPHTNEEGSARTTTAAVQATMTTTSSWSVSTPLTSLSTSSLATPSTAPSYINTTRTATTTKIVTEIHENRTLSASDECKEINLDLLDSDHKELLATEGVDLVLQEKLDKEYEDLFRCQTCHKFFMNIDQLYCHQNELGHLELKQTPRGPGYLCWKKGCNQYFKTASTLQVHFREIHAKKSMSGCLSVQELESYKFTCGQCNFSFKSIEAMQRHTLIHLMHSVTQCRICSRRVNSVAKMRTHLEIVHGDLSLTDMTIQMEGIEANASLLFSSPAYEQFTAKMLLPATNSQSKSFTEDDEITVGRLSNGLDRHEDDVDEGDGMSDGYRDKQFIEDYMNSQSMAEEHYKDNNRKFKCHRCRVAFTSHKYLQAHNKTTQHKHWELTDKFEDPSRPYRCEICKESFTQKNILMVHFNSVSHLHKLKQQTHLNGESIFNTTALSHSSPSPTPHLHNICSPGNANSTSTTPQTNGSFDNGAENSGSHTKPYKCNICKVSYNNQPSIEIHLRSVGHKTKASKLSELIQTGQVDLHQALIEHPDPRTAGKQQAQIIADMIHQQATAQAASNAAATYFNLQGMQGLNVMTQLLQGMLPASSHQLLASSTQNALAATSTAHLEAFYASLNAHNSINAREGSRVDNCKQALTKDKIVKSGDGDKIMNMIIKQDGKIEPANSELKFKPGQFDSKLMKDPKALNKEEELPPNFPHAPIITRPRGFMGRFKPQLHRSLLENFGFECVMHFNEENCPENKKPKEDKHQEEEHRRPENMESKKENGDEIMDLDDRGNEKSGDEKPSPSDMDDKKDENKENVDLPELNKCRCLKCDKDFSNVWVLKNHEESVHSNFVPPEDIEDFGKKFREGWEKNLPKLENDQTGALQLPSNPPTPTSNADKLTTSEMPPPPPPSQNQVPPNFDMSQLSQLLPLMGLNMLPMHLPLNLPMNMSLQGFPSLMIPPLDLTQSYLPPLQSTPLVDTTVASQQQLQAAAAAAAAAAQQAQNQKRVRTRISDDQLKVLRQYFDINNSPSEEQINKMSDQTGLPQKVIKHWFRNTLFKERQRNKDSPYNFNNPPSTSIDLDEYDRTGKIPEVKLEPEEEDESGNSIVHDFKKDGHMVKEENVNDRDDDPDEDIIDNPPLRIDLAPKTELGNDCRKDQESHSNTSSPSNMSSIPSTPTASAPATPTPMLTANALNAANIAFSLESYAANIARLEAATFQSMGKRANRTRFTDFQIKTLQDYFERNAYPKDDELEHLSKVLGLSARVIVVWFQNARQKARKIYENQPTSETAKELTSPFQRTPGLNYQCKKCNSVFQRYYELIKHQKNSCVGESNNNHKPIHSMMEDDSNYSYSNDDISFHERQSDRQPDRQSNSTSALRERDIQVKVSEIPTISTSLASSVKLTGTAPVSLSSSLPSYASSSLPTFKCDKCPMTFSRYDMWQDHQKTHVAPAMYTPFSSSSAFGMLQNLAQQEDTTKSPLSLMTTPSSLVPSLVSAPPMLGSQQSASMATTPTSSSTSPSPSFKRKTDSEDESGEQPRDKRLRTTILPEQLDYLYQQYQVDCNPSRKQLEHIASTVNLKKRVVQVWFQNTRARERKGHYRAHQQLINKRCPFCRALFRAKSALESHLATKHPEEMAKGDINIDLIPDAIIEPPSPHSLTGSSGLGSSSSHPDLTKLLPPGAAAAMPSYMAFMSSPAAALNLPFSSQTPELLGHPSFDDPFFKKYMSELASNLTARQEHPTPSTSHSPQTPSPTITAHSTPKPTHQTPSPSFNPTTRPVDAHKPKSTAPPSSASSIDDTPLDLSKPVKPAGPAPSSHTEPGPRMIMGSSLDLNERERAMELEYLRRLNSLDDSFSETQSEMADNEYMNDVGGSPPSPTLSHTGMLNTSSHTPGSTGKRYRTQMSATQVKVMKHLFQDYKTPTMAECELLGQEIGLAKRVVQVWFQNARAKEKKAKLNSGKPFNAELDFPKSPEECKLCGYKYSHKVTVQDHIFTKTHIDRVKAFLHSENDRDLDLSSGSLPNFSRTSGELERGQNVWDDSLPAGHLAQLQAMGINTSTMGFPLGQGENLKNAEKSEPVRKEKKSDVSVSISKEEQQQQQQVQAAMELAMNAQMLSALGGYMPSLDPTYLSYMYGGLPSYFPGMGLSVVQPGLIPGPEHMMAFDPLAYGTPLALLQIPAAAIKSVGEKLSEAGAVLARYTQDCQALADLHSVVSSADLTVAAEATLDVGYICKKCQMVYPARESCVAHQRSVCLATASSLPKGFEPIMKLEQVQYECRACSERFSTIMEFKAHCLLESHKSRLLKFKAKEAARREAAGSPSSSAPYSSSIGKSISPSASFTSKLSLTSPSNNNNNNNNISPAHCSKPLVPTPAHQFSKLTSSSTPPTMFRDKQLAQSPGFSEIGEMKRLKAE